MLLASIWGASLEVFSWARVSDDVWATPCENLNPIGLLLRAAICPFFNLKA